MKSEKELIKIMTGYNMEVASRLSKEDILLQLAEEASELSQAAAKYLRVLRSTNPTPVDAETAADNIEEECADVLNTLTALLLKTNDIGRVHSAFSNMLDMAAGKSARWVERLDGIQSAKEKEDNAMIPARGNCKNTRDMIICFLTAELGESFTKAKPEKREDMVRTGIALWNAIQADNDAAEGLKRND